MFVWTEPKRESQGSDAAAAMYKKELEERATLLLHLGRSPAFIKARLAANVAWDFPSPQRAPHAADVDRIVDAIVKRGR